MKKNKLKKSPMKKSTLLSTALVAVIAGAAAFGAQAADKGFYAGAGVGQSYVDEGAYDDEDTAFSVFGGYQFNRYFGLEGGYADFGKLEPRGSGTPLEASSVYLTAVGTVPITDRFSAYAKAGFQRWDLDRSIPSIVGNTDDNGTDPTYGLGVQYSFTDNVALRGEYSRFEVEDTDLDLAQIQLRYDF